MMDRSPSLMLVALSVLSWMANPTVGFVMPSRAARSNDIIGRSTVIIIKNGLHDDNGDDEAEGDSSFVPTTEVILDSDLPSRFGLDKVAPSNPKDRRLFFASSLFTTGAMIAAANPANALEAAATTAEQNFQWVKDPVNKRYGVTVDDATKAGYNDAFITYLSRFLLNFDKDAQALWFSEQPSIPLRATQEQVSKARLDQFSQFAASVSIGLLQNYAGSDGPTKLLQQLKARFCPPELVGPKGVVPASSGPDDAAAKVKRRQRREAREALRQLAILFGLLDTKAQPTVEITKILATLDNASIQSIQFDVVSDKPIILNGYSEDGLQPVIEIPPPQAGDGEYTQAKGTAILTPTGKLLRVDLADAGAGYDPKSPPTITVSPPSASSEDARTAVLKAKVASKGPLKGTIEKVEIVDFGSGYSAGDKIEIHVSLPPPPLLVEGLDAATAVVDPALYRKANIVPVLDLEVTGVKIVESGSGYAAERPLKVMLVQPGNKGKQGSEQKIEIGRAFPQAEKTSYTSFRKDGDTNAIKEQQTEFYKKYQIKPNKDDDGRVISGTSSGPDSGLPALPFGGRGSSSQQLLSLLPQGFGLEYDREQKLYFLAVDEEFRKKYTNIAMQPSSNRPLVPDFGPRGRSPIERDMQLGLGAYLRFSLSGAVCASAVHLVLTPLDVVKTKVQTNPSKYKKVSSSFGVVLKEEGPSTFFTGWAPTFFGNFMSGAVLYALTEAIRRTLTDMAGVDALSLEVPIILLAAATASAAGSIIICPFEAVRIRSVAQPDYAPNALGVVSRLFEEEGIGAFINAIPVFLLKNIPYAMVKFTVFDLSTEYLFHEYPIANEDLKLSLLISLLGGVLGGTSAAVVSNPADAVISELKKTKSDMSPQEAVTAILDRGGVGELFKGLSVRMIYYSLVASLQFTVYDGVRFALGIGADDLKLYLDVLGAVSSTAGGGGVGGP